MNRRAVVIGAGLGGLSTAAHLVGRGYEVVVIERDNEPGGRAGRLEIDGYTFDTGPTVITMPDLLRSTFAAVDAELDDAVDLVALDPVYRACFADGSVLHVRSGEAAMTQEIREVCGPRDAAAFARFCAWLRTLYETEMPNFIDRNYDSVLDLARPLRPALALARVGGFGRLQRKVQSYFADERLQRVFSFQSLYAGLAPYEALALFGVITYMDSVAGAYYPRGGVHQLPLALAGAVEKAGARMIFGDGADEVLLSGGDRGRVRGVRLSSGETITADAVVCNAELPYAYPRLLPYLSSPRRLRHVQYSPSAFVWHAGVRGVPGPKVAHHNLHFGHDVEPRVSRALLRDGRRMPDPSTLVTVPSVTDPRWLQPVARRSSRSNPCRTSTDVSTGVENGPKLATRCATRLAGLGYPTDVEVEAVYDPIDWHALGLARGTPFSAAHRFFQSGPFRTPNIDARAPGLVFAGAGTVPGVGVPMVVLSGRLAAERVEEYMQ